MSFTKISNSHHLVPIKHNSQKQIHLHLQTGLNLDEKYLEMFQVRMMKIKFYFNYIMLCISYNF